MCLMRSKAHVCALLRIKHKNANGEAIDESETITFLANAYSMLEDAGHLLVTVSMTTEKHETSGVCYYSKTTVINFVPCQL